MSGTPEHRAWKGMWARCLAKPGDKYFHLYPKQGIKVCARWKKFENFFADVGPRPSPQHSLDRWPDPHGDYKPSNVRWATMKEQSNNRRDNRIVELNGKKFTLSTLADATGFKVGTLRSRLYKLGWDTRKAVASPLNVTSIRAFTDAELQRQQAAIEAEIRRRRVKP